LILFGVVDHLYWNEGSFLLPGRIDVEHQRVVVSIDPIFTQVETSAKCMRTVLVRQITLQCIVETAMESG